MNFTLITSLPVYVNGLLNVLLSMSENYVYHTDKFYIDYTFPYINKWSLISLNKCLFKARV